MRAIALVLCAVLLCPVATAQDRGEVPDAVAKREADSRATVAALLDSTDAKERAWGARIAGDQGLREFAPALVALAASKDENGRVRAAAIDALIRFDAEVPAETAESIHEDYPDEAIVLLAKPRDGVGPAMLSLAGRETDDVRWLGLCNLLAGMKAPGFAAALLRDLTVRVAVSVSEDGSGWGGGFGSGVSIGCGGAGLPNGFPPRVDYRLTTSDARNAVVLAPGPRTIYYVRRVDASGDSVEDIDRDSARIEYLSWMLGGAGLRRPGGEDVLAADISFQITWSDATEYEAKMRGIRKQVLQRYAWAVERLEEAGLLTEGEAKAAEPHVEIVVKDLRADRSTPLPD